MSTPNRSYVYFRAVAMILLAVIDSNLADAQPPSIEDSMARLRRLLHVPNPSLVRPYTQGVPFASLIRKAARVHGIEPALLAGLARVESNFDPRAVSSAGAQGLGQLMPATARELGVVDPFDPYQNLEASSRYLANQLRVFRSTRLALAAYNAGPTRVEQGTVPASTWRYVKRVERIANAYRMRGIP